MPEGYEYIVADAWLQMGIQWIRFDSIPYTIVKNA